MFNACSSRKRIGSQTPHSLKKVSKQRYYAKCKTFKLLSFSNKWPVSSVHILANLARLCRTFESVRFFRRQHLRQLIRKILKCETSQQLRYEHGNPKQKPTLYAPKLGHLSPDDKPWNRRFVGGSYITKYGTIIEIWSQLQTMSPNPGLFGALKAISLGN